MYIYIYIYIYIYMVDSHETWTHWYYFASLDPRTHYICFHLQSWMTYIDLGFVTIPRKYDTARKQSFCHETPS